MKKQWQNTLLFLIVAAAFAGMAYFTILDENYTKINGEYVANTVAPTWTPIPTDFEVLVDVISEPKLDGDNVSGFWTDLYVEVLYGAPYYDAESIWQLRFPESMMPGLMKDWTDSNGELKLILVCNDPWFSNFRMNCENEYRKSK